MDWQRVQDEIEGEELTGKPVVVSINGRMYEANDLRLEQLRRRRFGPDHLRND